MGAYMLVEIVVISMTLTWDANVTLEAAIYMVPQCSLFCRRPVSLEEALNPTAQIAST